jgi:formate hydrogenlyase subunit 3/multisubunit Na+/H+ antiporter MnhD subunit
MKIITAVCSFFAAVVLVLIQVKLPAFPGKILPQVLSVFICLVCLLTLYASLYSYKTGHETRRPKCPFSFYCPGLRRP